MHGWVIVKQSVMCEVLKCDRQGPSLRRSQVQHCSPHPSTHGYKVGCLGDTTEGVAVLGTQRHGGVSTSKGHLRSSCHPAFLMLMVHLAALEGQSVRLC